MSHRIKTDHVQAQYIQFPSLARLVKLNEYHLLQTSAESI